MNILRILNARSIRFQSLLYFWLTAFLALAVVSVMSYRFARELINEEIGMKMEHQISGIRNSIDLMLVSHSGIPAGIARVVESFGTAPSKRDYAEMLKKYLALNPDTLGAGIWFEPYRYRPGVKFFGPYNYKDGDKIVYTEEYETEKYNYPSWEWYKIAVNTQRATVWTDPYYDETTGITMITTSAPFYGPDRKLMGVATGDIDLTNMQRIVSEIRLGETGSAFLLSKKGEFIADRNKEIIMKKPVTESENPSLAQLGRDILSGEKGSGSYKADDGVYNVYYSRIESTGWYLGLKISRDELYSPLNRLLLSYLVIAFIMLAVTGFLSKFISQLISTPVMRLNENIEQLTNGDLAISEASMEKMKGLGADLQGEKSELVTLIINYKRLVIKLREIIIGVTDITNDLASSSQEMAATSASFAESAQGQAASAEEITATVEQISAGMEGIAGSAEDQSKILNALVQKIEELSSSITEMERITSSAASLISDINSRAKSGEGSLNSMNESMAKILASSTDMSNIVEMITGISEQINLLSLNAAIEAARAGDAGRGFAVVADEISKLADQTASSIKEINILIKGNDDEINKGMKDVMSSVETISGIISGINSINEIIEKIGGFVKLQVEANSIVSSESGKLQIKSEEIRAATREEQIAVTEIVKSISNINDLTQSVASGAEEISASSEAVADTAEQLKGRIGFFRL